MTPNFQSRTSWFLGDWQSGKVPPSPPTHQISLFGHDSQKIATLPQQVKVILHPRSATLVCILRATLGKPPPARNSNWRPASATLRFPAIRITQSLAVCALFIRVRLNQPHIANLLEPRKSPLSGWCTREDSNLHCTDS